MELELVKASEQGDAEKVQHLLNLGANVHSGANEALLLAVYCQHLEVVKILLKHGAMHSEALFTASGQSGFAESKENIPLEMMKELVQYGADIGTQYRQCLVYASGVGNMEMVKFILEQGMKTKEKRTSLEHDNTLQYAMGQAQDNGHHQVMKLLFDQMEYDDDGLNEAFLNVTHDGNLELTKLLIARGADIHTAVKINIDGKERMIKDAALLSALEIKDELCCKEMVTFLLDNGVKKHERDRTFLQHAAEHASKEVVDLLLSRGAAGTTGALHVACASDKQATVKFLLLRHGKKISAEECSYAFLRLPKRDHLFGDDEFAHFIFAWETYKCLELSLNKVRECVKNNREFFDILSLDDDKEKIITIYVAGIDLSNQDGFDKAVLVLKNHVDTLTLELYKFLPRDICRLVISFI